MITLGTATRLLLIVRPCTGHIVDFHIERYLGTALDLILSGCGKINVCLIKQTVDVCAFGPQRHTISDEG